MFSNLSNKLSSAFNALRRKGALTEADIDSAMREVRIALLEADVALPIVKEFVASLKEKAVGAEIVKSISPAQMVVKLVHDHLIELLGSEDNSLNLNTTPPAIILMCGLQGSGKTTTSGKLALRLSQKQRKKVLLASLDIYRPAAQQQLEVLAKQTQVGSLPIMTGQSALQIAERALDMGRKEGYDIVILDTAGRLHIDDELMDELRQVKEFSKPIETLLVLDSLTGQDAVNVAQQFHDKIGVTGTILTRVDGDARGGAALSMRKITGKPIKFLGAGEKLSDLEEFDAKRVASRVLDMGDVVSLVEKAAEAVTQEDAEKMAKKLQQGKFDFDDLLDQLRKMKKMGGFSSLINMLPGMGQFKEQIENANIDESILKRQEAIILAMTPKERQFPKLLNASRRIRIAKGSGTTVQDVNKLYKQYQQMETMVRKMKGKGMKEMMKGGLKNFLPPMR